MPRKQIIQGLGRVSNEQAKAHEDAGDRFHDWYGDIQYTRFSGNGKVGRLTDRQACSICGKTREVDTEKQYVVVR